MDELRRRKIVALRREMADSPYIDVLDTIMDFADSNKQALVPLDLSADPAEAYHRGHLDALARVATALIVLATGKWPPWMNGPTDAPNGG